MLTLSSLEHYWGILTVRWHVHRPSVDPHGPILGSQNLGPGPNFLHYQKLIF